MKKLYLLIPLLLLFFSISANGIPNPVILTDTSQAYDLSSLRAYLIDTYGETDTNAILYEESSKHWVMKYGLVVSSGDFYINNSICTSLKLGKDSSHQGLTGNISLANVNITGYNFTSNTHFDTINDWDNGPTLHIYKSLHDVDFNDCESVYLSTSAHKTSGLVIRNVTGNRFGHGFLISYGSNFTVDNVTIRDGSRCAWGIGGNSACIPVAYDSMFSNISVFNGSGGVYHIGFAYGFWMCGSNNTMTNLYINNTGWSGALFVDNNWTVNNVTIINAGHVGLETEAENSTFNNFTVINSTTKNLQLIGHQIQQTWGENITYSNITSCYPSNSTENDDIHARMRNVLVKDSTFINGGGPQCIDSINVTYLNCTARNTGTGGAFLKLNINTTGGYEAYSADHRVIDPHVVNYTYKYIWAIDGDVALINPESTNYMISYSDANITTYYYPNIKVVNKIGIPVKDAVITANTTCRDGYGNIQTSFYTGADGKIDMSNRSARMAIPDIYINNSWIQVPYYTNITASKSGQTNSTILNPNSTWSSPNPVSSLSAPETILTLDAKSLSANFTGIPISGNSPLTVQFNDTSEWSP